MTPFLPIALPVSPVFLGCCLFVCLFDFYQTSSFWLVVLNSAFSAPHCHPGLGWCQSELSLTMPMASLPIAVHSLFVSQS